MPKILVLVFLMFFLVSACHKDPVPSSKKYQIKSTDIQWTMSNDEDEELSDEV